MGNSSLLATIAASIDADEDFFRNEKATGTITSVSTLEETLATGTVTIAGVLAGDTVTINGLIYTAVAGVKADNTEFSIDGTDIASATDLADSITNDARTPITVPLIDTTGAGAAAVVTVTAKTAVDGAGTGGNSIDLASSNGARLAVSGAFLTGGVDADIVTVNGLKYKAVAGARADDTEFSTDTSDNATATDLAAAITADVRAGTVLDVVATATTNVVTVEETVGGTGGNAITLATTDATTLAVSGATLTGGTTPKHNIDFSVEGSGTRRTPQYLIVLCHSVEALTLKIAYDGSTFVNLGPVLVADAVNEFKVPVVVGDIINFQCASDITLRRFNVLAIYNAAS